MKVLAIDIGNTNCDFGFFDNNELTAKWRLSSSPIKTEDEYECLLSHLFQKNGINAREIDATVICSVVPSLVEPISGLLTEMSGRRVKIIGKDIKPPVGIEIYNPNELGMDRWVNAYAGHHDFGGPLIIVDFGTAITFDIVSVKGSYIGGIILPGVGISLEALNTRTAQLPKTSFAKPASVIGKSTLECIQSGSYYGSVYQISGLIEHLCKELDAIGENSSGSLKILATGGASNELSKRIDKFDHILPNLTLRGILLAYVDAEQ